MGSVAEPCEIAVDVSSVLPGRGAPLSVAASVFLPDVNSPDAMGDGPVRVVFAYPGGGYGRYYYDLDPDGPGGSQARALAAAGIVVVACDHLGVGESSPLPRSSGGPRCWRRRTTRPRWTSASGSRRASSMRDSRVASSCASGWGSRWAGTC